MTVAPAVSLALNSQRYSILISDNISVDDLAQAMSQLIREYDEYIDARATFAITSASASAKQNIIFTFYSIP